MGSGSQQQRDESSDAQARAGETSDEHVIDLRDRPEGEGADRARERFPLGQFNVLGLLPLTKKESDPDSEAAPEAESAAEPAALETSPEADRSPDVRRTTPAETTEGGPSQQPAAKGFPSGTLVIPLRPIPIPAETRPARPGDPPRHKRDERTSLRTPLPPPARRRSTVLTRKPQKLRKLRQLGRLRHVRQLRKLRQVRQLRDRKGLFAAVAVVVGLALVAGLITLIAGGSDAPSSTNAGSPGVQRPRSTSLSPGARLWLKAQTAAGTEVALPAATQKDIGKALPKLEFRSFEAAESHPVDLLVLPSIARDEPSEALQGFLGRSEPVAQFYDGSQFRSVLKSGNAASALAARKRLGRQVVGDSRIRVTPHAYVSLMAGEVDLRVMGLLLRVANVHTVDVFGFPREGPERAARAPAREVHVTAVDGKLVTEDTAAAGELQSMMNKMPSTYQPAETGAPSLAGAPGGLLVRFRLPTGA